MADTRELEVQIKYTTDKAGAAQAKRTAAEVGAATEKAATEAARVATRAAEQARQRIEAQFDRIESAAEKLSTIGGSLAGVGAGILAPLTLAANAYLQTATESDRVAQRWRASQERIAEAGERVGAVVVERVLPYLEDAAALAEKTAAFVEAHPGAIEAALTIGGSMAALGGALVVAEQVAQTIAAVAKLGGLFGAGSAAASAGAGAAGAAGSAAGGAGLAALALPAAIVGGGVLAAGAIDKAGQAATGRSLGQNWTEFTSIVSYGLGSLIGKGDEFFEFTSGLGASITDTGQKAQESERVITGMNLALQNRIIAAGQLESATTQLRAVESRMAEQTRDARIQAAQQAAQAEQRAAQQAEDAAIASARRVADSARAAGEQRARIAAQYAQAQVQAEKTYTQAIEQARAQHGKQMADIERAYRQRVADIGRDYDKSVAEATLNRDAIALYRAQQTRQEQLDAAQTDQATQQQDAQVQYTEQLAQAEQARQESLEAARVTQEQALVDLQASLQREAEAQALADARRFEDEQRAAAREAAARQAQLQQRLGQITDALDSEYQIAVTHYNRMAQLAGATALTQTYAPQGSSSGRTTRRGGRAGGGYAEAGLYTLGEAGREFVLSAPTTRVLEGAYGAPLTQQAVAGGRGGVTVNATFTGMGNGDRTWFEQRLNDFSQQLAQTLGG